MKSTNHRRFRFTPADVLRGIYIPRSKTFAAWQWFVRELYDAHPKASTPYEWINGTSSIDNGQPNRIFSVDEPHRRLRELLVRVGCTSPIAKFLHRCGLRNWASLDKPMTINVPTCEDFPQRSWFELQGRQFRVSPNKLHADATFVQSGGITLAADGRLWSFSVEYGYHHDLSHWWWHIEQRPRESLGTFAARINVELEAALEPETTSPGSRLSREREWNVSYKALRDLFWDDIHLGMTDWRYDAADRLCEVTMGGWLANNRILLTPPRLATLRRWITETVAAQKKAMRKR